MEVYFHLFIVLEIGGGEDSPLSPGHFTPGDRADVTLGTEGCGGAPELVWNFRRI
jgi:hypothetical protein